ncbi:HNH endonuclease [Bacillus safensis]|uniref:HNH endonuclease n=1 Tax=Bacillus safensis TaxID=561879 RepID=UPI00300033C5
MNSQQYYDKHQRNKTSAKFYRSKAWRLCREEVLRRDHYLCQDCLTADRITAAETVHHIEELTDRPDIALSIDNLISLCNSCHNKRHPEKGPKKKDAPKKQRRITVVRSQPNEDIGPLP